MALLKVVDLCYYNMVVGRPIRVITRHSTLSWLFRSNGFQGWLQQWAAILSPWDLTVEKAPKGEEICGLLAASVTPTSEIDCLLESIEPRRVIRRSILDPAVPKIDPNEETYVISFDGSAKPKRSRGSYAAIVWKLPDCQVVEARSVFTPDATVNEAEYRVLLLGLEIATDLRLHPEYEDLRTLNRLNEILILDQEPRKAKIAAVMTRRGSRRAQETEDLLGTQRIRVDRIRQAQDEENWIKDLKSARSKI